jgi:hypothetical protein
VAARPDSVKRFDSLLAVATIAHEAIFEMRRDLIGQDRGGPEQARLLAESARIVTVDLPTVSTTARQISAMWKEQSVLDPGAAKITLAELESELARIQPEIDALLSRQRAIAAQMRSMSDPEG